MRRIAREPSLFAMTEAIRGAEAHLKEFKKEGLDKTAIENLKSTEEVETHLKNVRKMVVDFKKHDIFTAFRDACNQASKLIKEVEKKQQSCMKASRKRTYQNQDEEGSVPKMIPGGHSLSDLCAQLEGGKCGLGSVSQALWNLKAWHTSTSQSKEVASTMRKSSYYVKQLKWTTRYMAEHSLPAAASAIMKAGADAEMQKLKTDPRGRGDPAHR